ncbi:CDP-glycerol glycerophosphotransferase family protein, partial [Staphylococcus epidermidis]|uniref:CDP-glycerol glycerophosphotransferase family protein n=1 Tax=Staphylococcus epidermidis TaxID=1282 RepID=UPI0037DA0C47
MLLTTKNKQPSFYHLTHKQHNLKPKTILFQSFPPNNYTHTPNYIYQYIQNYYPNYPYISSFNNPHKNLLPGSPQNLK